MFYHNISSKKKTDKAMVKRKRQTKQWSKEKGHNNDLQNTTQKTKDRGAPPTPLKTGTLGCFGRVSSEIIHFSDVTLDPASKGNVVGMIRQMTTAF
jgi:hypothetical protein